LGGGEGKESWQDIISKKMLMVPDHTNIGKVQEICRLLSKLIYPATFFKKFPGLIIIMESFWEEWFRIFWNLTKGNGFTKKN
jgi:hypothetical protein